MGKRIAKQRAARWKRKRVGHIPGYKPEAETAEELGVALRTLRSWRQRGIGPAYVKFARQIHYSDDARAAWLKRQEVQPVRSELAA